MKKREVKKVRKPKPRGKTQRYEDTLRYKVMMERSSHLPHEEVILEDDGVLEFGEGAVLEEEAGLRKGDSVGGPGDFGEEFLEGFSREED